MRLTPLPEVQGVTLVEQEPFVDERGTFARAFCAEEFVAAGLEPAVAQANVSTNHRAGTWRGLHRSAPPHRESKLVRCVRGAIVDVAVDVRPDSPTYLGTVQVELSAENGRSLYLPPHVAHGYLTLTDDTEVIYLVSSGYVPGAEEGFRYDDPAFGLVLPRPVAVISEKDGAWASFSQEPATEVHR